MDEEAIFAAALECATPEKRQVFVKEACAGDAKLQSLVEELLQAHYNPDSFLQAPAANFVASVEDPVRERPGTVIGPYKLLEQIGEGGMGLVFMAEQSQPVRRRVALKVIKPGMDTRHVVARFEAERQALALMDHPNIAHVFDAGTTDSGRPYFVMELVRGVPITEFCDQRRLTTRQRLELFVTVCQAVQHAHQKGIIHRDLKPSNVLVTLHDTIAVPKIIDFGIAKATTEPLTERTLFTNFAQMMGTPLYMSPEQAEMNGLDVDTRSDVYALGVLLYELLTGTTPFESQTLKKVGLDEMRRMIREEEPPTPSQRLHTLSAQVCSTVSEQRGVDSRRLGQVLRGELDWIVMKALEKDRNRRYESASAFAADVQRYLNDEAVAACPPSAGYRLRKFARRYRRPLLSAGVILVALVTASVVSAWQAVAARDAQHQAEADRERAETALTKAEAAEQRATTEAAIARAVNNFLQEDLLRQAGSAPQDGEAMKGDPNLSLREALDRASAKVSERFRDQPLVEAAIRMAIGETYGGLGENGREVEHKERALELRRAHLGPDHPETLYSMRQLAGAYSWTGRAPNGIVLYEELLANTRAKLGPDHPETSQLMYELAMACRRAGDWRKAMRLLEQVVEKDEALRGPTAAGASGSAQILGMLYLDAGKYLDAASRLERVYVLREATLGPDDRETLYAKRIWAEAYQRAGKLDEADRLYRCVLERSRSRRDTLGQIYTARLLIWLSLNSLLRDRCEEAEQLAREAMALYKKNEQTSPSSDEWLQFYLMNLLGGTLLGQKKYADAEPLLVQGYEGLKQRQHTILAQRRFRVTEAGERVIRYYEETNQPEKAREWRERLSRDQSEK